ncbi:family 43 glycosylhydrolase [Microbacterium pumilum]|uniref:Glycoside hydrolase family 43 protein n=1 Tax=Microbacterium pumilum TaxID=344165 RepID=A0ABP5EE91_9MICO
MTYDSIRPGAEWLDTGGKPIQSHAGSIFHEDGVFYWYGENKEHTTPGSGIWHWGIRCYSSTDLYNWEDRGLLIPPTPDDPDSPFHPSRFVDRPHIIHNTRTGKYVCWVKIMGTGHEQLSTILTADAFLGPYEIVSSDYRPLGMNAGDFDLVVDPTDGKGYYYFERVHSELICADLTDDYTAVTGYYSTHFPRAQPPDVREAPAYFRRGSRHHLITSGTSWYYPNPSEVAAAPSYHGPFAVLGDPHPFDTSRTSYRTQISSIFRHPHKRDLYIALGDRWLPDLAAAESNKEEAFRVAFTENATGDATEAMELPDADTSRAVYVWLPLRFDEDRPVIDWRDEWRIEDFA